jgi:hypothetical protein
MKNLIKKIYGCTLLIGVIFVPISPVYAADDVTSSSSVVLTNIDTVSSTSEVIIQQTVPISGSNTAAINSKETTNTTTDIVTPTNPTIVEPMGAGVSTSNISPEPIASTSANLVSVKVNKGSNLTPKIQTNEGPPKAFAPSSFKSQPNLALAPNHPTDTSVTPTPSFSVIVVVPDATSTATSSESVATSTDETSVTPISTGKDSQSTSTPVLPINNGTIASSTASTTESTNSDTNTSTSTRDETLPVVPTDPAACPSVSPDTSATVTKPDDSIAGIPIPISE